MLELTFDCAVEKSDHSVRELIRLVEENVVSGVSDLEKLRLSILKVFVFLNDLISAVVTPMEVSVAIANSDWELAGWVSKSIVLLHWVSGVRSDVLSL